MSITKDILTASNAEVSDPVRINNLISNLDSKKTTIHDINMAGVTITTGTYNYIIGSKYLSVAQLSSLNEIFIRDKTPKVTKRPNKR